MWTPSSSREDQIIRFIIKRTHIGHIEAHREGERDLRLGAGLVVVGGSFAVDIACAPFRRHRGIRKRNELGGCIFASLENFSSRLAWEALLPGQRRWNHRKRNRRGKIYLTHTHTLSLSLNASISLFLSSSPSLAFSSLSLYRVFFFSSLILIHRHRGTAARKDRQRGKQQQQQGKKGCPKQGNWKRPR